MPAGVPIITIQCDWNDVLWNNNGEAWVSAKFLNQPSTHGKLKTKCILNDTPQITCSEGFKVGRISRVTIEITFIPSDTTVSFVAPSATYNIHDKSIQSLDVANGGLGVSTCSGDKLIVWDAKNGLVRRTLEGHVSTLYRCRFFPSGIVILSAGSDMSLKVWSAETGENPVSLAGHTMAVTDFAIIDKGRNIISVSKDGRAKLWDVGMSLCLADLLVVDNINCCCIHSLEEYTPVQIENEREIGTNGKVFLAGCESGMVYAVLVAERQMKFSQKLPSPVNACCILNDGNLLVGCQDGQLYKLSTNTGEILVTIHESASPVICLSTFHSGWFSGRQDGSCIWQQEFDRSMRYTLTGPDCDPIRDICHNEDSVYTGCRDGQIRKYNAKRFLSC